ncbi:MAG: Chemotaxis protein CheW [Gemmatimonadaceae bacterium]|nr:Chemotaxis protein CheW [Gemmatimonadaceae bacterium]
MTSQAERPRVVTFRIGRDLYAAPIEGVERVLRYEPPRRIPGGPSWVEGVVEYSGRVVPVVNLAQRLCLDDGEVGISTRILVLSSVGEWMAIVVDSVLDVRSLGDLEPPPRSLRAAALDAMQGITRRDGDLVIVLDIGRLLASSGDLPNQEPSREYAAVR